MSASGPSGPLVFKMMSIQEKNDVSIKLNMFLKGYPLESKTASKS